MNHFQYRGDVLYCEDVSLQTIADAVGTPAYVYSHATLTRHYQVFDAALEGIPHIVCYSVKACSNLAVLKLLFGLGSGADIVSGGELYRCLAAGADPNKIVFSGVGKTRAEMELALEAGILSFNIESEPELRLLDRVAGEIGVKAPVSIRVNPDVDPETHPYISTGLQKNKFGIPASETTQAYQVALELANLEVVGIDCHIGSQLTKMSPFTDAVERLAERIQGLRRAGVDLRHLDIGGGLGIRYGEEEVEPPSPAEYGHAIKQALTPLTELDLTLICEPGRVIAGNAGLLLTRVLYQKRNPVKEFLIVDGAMNDLIRPSLYGSFHPIRPVERHLERDCRVVDVVGPICETGDFLARDRELRVAEAGEVLAVGAAGAYGFAMSSNYNSRPRCPEVMVKGDQWAIIRGRETMEQLVAGESVPEFV